MFLTPDKIKTYRAIVVLNEMLNTDRLFQTSLAGDDRALEPLFNDLRSNGYAIISNEAYKITAKGREIFDTFMKRYTEYLKVYDVYSFVDLEKGEFAFASYYDFETDDDWFNYTDDERFDDLRIAVAIFKKLDPAEIVFMSFLNENRFGTDEGGWQDFVMSNEPWDEIEEICHTAIKPEEVGEDAMVDMIKQGSQLMLDLMKEEQNRNQGGGATGGYTTETYTVVEEETVDYYQPYYYDPFYISPIWMVPLFLW